MAVFGYGRVSTNQQTVDNQRLEIEKAGFSIDYWFSDALSGKTTAAERPQFRELLGKIRSGETIVVSRLDRIGRDAQDVLATIKMLSERKIKVIVLQLGTTDLTSSAGKLLMTMLSAVAEMERDLLIERTQAGLARAKAEGKILGRKPKTSMAQREQIKTAYLAGASISALARDYSISRSSILSIVK